MDEEMKIEMTKLYPSKVEGLRIALELKYLAKHAPNGVYIAPEQDNGCKLHGVIFIRRGLYQDGIFRFTVSLPKSYNSIGALPIVHFTSTVYSPLVDPNNGTLNMKAATEINDWDPEIHSLMTVATAVKRVFFIQSFEALTDSAPNAQALQLFGSDKSAYMKKIDECVQLSLQKQFQAPPAGCPLVFTESTTGHAELLAVVNGLTLDVPVISQVQQEDDELVYG